MSVPQGRQFSALFILMACNTWNHVEANHCEFVCLHRTGSALQVDLLDLLMGSGELCLIPCAPPAVSPHPAQASSIYACTELSIKRGKQVVRKVMVPQDRPPLCPFRLSPLLTCSGSTIAFLKILKFQGPNPKI